MTSTFDSPATWRDYADRLTAAQIEQFEQYEARFSDPAESAWMAVEARELVERNAADAAMFAHLPAPAGAVRVEVADQDEHGSWSRSFDGAVRRVCGVEVGIDGTQHADGRIERQLTIMVSDFPGSDGGRLTAEQARALAVTLLELVEELKSYGGAL